MNTEIETFLAELNLINLGELSFKRLLTGGKMSVSAVYGNDTSQHFVIKFLICPIRTDQTQQFILEQENHSLAEEWYRDHPELEVKPMVVNEYEKKENMPIYFYSMEMLQGSTLADKFQSNPLPWSEIDSLTILLKTTRALRGVSAVSVCHSDIHPGNIFITNDSQVKIIDFGVSKNLSKVEIGEQQISTLRLEGAISCWSPEYLKMPKTISFPHDVWALGTLFFHLITGKYAIDGKSLMDYLSKIGNLPKSLELEGLSLFPKELIIKMLSSECTERPKLSEIEKMINDYLSKRFENFLKSHEEMTDRYFKNNGTIMKCGLCKTVHSNKRACTNCKIPTNQHSLI